MQPETVLELYREHNPGFNIKKEDLFPNNKYQRNNKWNNSTTPGCIMHLIHRNNTLGAQFHLAGQSTVLRINSNGKPIRESDRLILCSRLGGPTRNSDPHVSSSPYFFHLQQLQPKVLTPSPIQIGIEVNNLAHGQMLITVADPIGLYLDSFDGNSFHAPDDADVNSFWKWTRGTPAHSEGGNAHWVRAVFEVPPEKEYVVGDIQDQNGNKIQWEGQLADHIHVRLTGQVIQAGLHAAEAYPCIGSAPISKVGNVSVQPYVDEEGYICDRAESIVDPGWCCY